MNQQEMEFDMLLNEVLETLANPEPANMLQEKVLMRLRRAQSQHAGATSAADGLAQPAAIFAADPTERSGFSLLWDGVCEIFLPKRSSPSVFEFRSAAVAERAVERRRPASVALALGLHAALICLMVFVVGSKLRVPVPTDQATVSILAAPLPPVAPRLRSNGGGGGQRGATPVSKGTPPKFAERQLLPPKAPPLLPPKIAIVPTVEVQREVKMQSGLANIGIVSAAAAEVQLSMGNGSGSGIGPGNGNGMGAGSGGNTGGGVYQVGGGVSAPIEIYRVDAEFSEEARKARLSGVVYVSLWVDERGRPTHVSVLRGLGMGLDEKAVEAVKQFRFKPAMKDGKPVTVELNIEVGFHIY